VLLAFPACSGSNIPQEETDVSEGALTTRVEAEELPAAVEKTQTMTSRPGEGSAAIVGNTFRFTVPSALVKPGCEGDTDGDCLDNEVEDMLAQLVAPRLFWDEEETCDGYSAGDTTHCKPLHLVQVRPRTEYPGVSTCQSWGGTSPDDRYYTNLCSYVLDDSLKDPKVGKWQSNTSSYASVEVRTVFGYPMQQDDGVIEKDHLGDLEMVIWRLVSWNLTDWELQSASFTHHNRASLSLPSELVDIAENLGVDQNGQSAGPHPNVLYDGIWHGSWPGEAANSDSCAAGADNFCYGLCDCVDNDVGNTLNSAFYWGAYHWMDNIHNVGEPVMAISPGKWIVGQVPGTSAEISYAGSGDHYMFSNDSGHGTIAEWMFYSPTHPEISSGWCGWKCSDRSYGSGNCNDSIHGMTTCDGGCFALNGSGDSVSAADMWNYGSADAFCYNLWGIFSRKPFAVCNSSADCTGGAVCSSGMCSYPPATLSINKNGPMTVTGSGNDGTSFSCGDNCSPSIDGNVTVTLTAEAGAGYHFNSWSGCDSTSGNTCTIKLQGVNKTVTASVAASTCSTDSDCAFPSPNCLGSNGRCGTAWKQEWRVAAATPDSNSQRLGSMNPSFTSNKVNLSNRFPNLHCLKKSSSAGDSWNAGATSGPKIHNGYLLFQPGSTNEARMVGLNHENTTSSFTDINYAIYVRHDARAFVYENGSNKGDIGTYTSNTTFKIDVTGNTVKYYKDGVLKYTSSYAPLFPLFVDTAFRTPTSDYRCVGPLVPRSGYYGGTVSEEYVGTNEDAVVEFRMNTTGDKFAGLTSGSDPYLPWTYYNYIDYAFRGSDGNCYIYENGSNKASCGTFTSDTVFEILVHDDTVQYFKDGNFIRQSAIGASRPLYFDTSLKTVNGRVDDVTFKKGFVMPYLFAAP